MAPGAALPDSANTSPPSSAGAGVSYWSRFTGAAAARFMGSNGGRAASDLNAHATPTGHVHINGDGRVNGQVNGQVNGHANGHTNGETSGNGFNGHTFHQYVTGSTANGTAEPSPSATPKTPEPIAIVGIGCRMPGSVTSPREFWELLSRCRTGFSEIPPERFDPASFYHPNAGKGGCYNPVGGNFLNEDLRTFDAPFFGLTEKEAISMDPQQRLLLECTFEALENAGIPKHHIVGKDVGVFVGGSFPEYESHLSRDSDTIPMHQATGCAYAMQSNRISHFFDLRGPSFTSDTACSSSMVAVHLACQSLRSGESSLALVGGCHLNMLPEFWISFSTCRLLSDSGRSIAFDSRGTGFGRGEGCAMVVLKPLGQAVKDNDAIRAVIVGTGINQDGKTPGITMPNGEAQESLMEQVYRNFNLNPKDCGFVEAHGTGTKVGDPIEATAIHKVLGKGRTPRDPLFIGSVKSNIGHLEAASGIAGIVKAALMLERNFILPNYDFKSPNPKIPWKQWNLKVPVMQRPWPRGKKYISVNNFGFGGTNGHVVMEAAPFKPKLDAMSTELVEKQHKMFVFSANDKTALATVMKNTMVFLEQRPEIFEMALMYNLAYTLGQRRSMLQWRAAIHAKDSFELIEAMNAQQAVTRKELESLRIGYIFTGQGAQWWAMGKELYDQYPVFRDRIDMADRHLIRLGSEWALVEELSRDEKTTRVSEAHISQPACTAVQLALVDLLQSWGVKPTAVAGHSSGEIGAAYAAGIITAESALTVAYHRGRLIPVLKKRFPELDGRMMAVGGTKEEVQPLIEGLQEREVRIACFNSPSSLTISGDEPALAELEKIVADKQMFNRRLMVDTAYHSHHMNLVAKEYRAALANLPPPTPSDVKFHSSLHGRLISGSELQPSYWVDNLTCPVRFSEAVESMLAPVDSFKTGVSTLVELGPHAALQGPVKQILKHVGGAAAKVTYDSALVRKKDAVETTMDLAASLFTKGANLNFGAVNFPKPGKPPSLLTDLPRYPWNYQTKYWQESRLTSRHKFRSQLRSDILGVEAIYSNDLEPTWRNIVRLDDLPWLRQHKIQSLAMFPMSAFMVMALEAAAQRAAKGSGDRSRADQKPDRFELRDVIIAKPLVVLDDQDVEVTTTLRPHQEGTLASSEVWDEFRICSYTQVAGWTEHCIGLVATHAREAANEVDGARQTQNSKALLRSTVAAVKESGTATLDADKMYDAMTEVGVVFGPAFQGIKTCEASSTHSTAQISVDDFSKEMPNEYLVSPIIHPCLLETLIGMYWPVLRATSTSSSLDTVYLPSAVSKVCVSAEAIAFLKEPGRLLRAYCSAAFSPGAPKPTKIDTIATSGDDATEPLITLEGLHIAPIIDGETQLDVEAARELCYKMEWEPILEPLSSSGSSGTQAEAEEPNGVVSETVTDGVSKAGSFPDLPIVIIHDDSNIQNLVALGLLVEIERLTARMPDAGSLGSIDAQGKTIIFLSELDRPMLSTLTATQFAQLQTALTGAEGCLWVVRGAYGHSTSPEANMIAGLSRSIRSESAMRFATLDLDGRARLLEEQTAEAIIKVFKAVFGRGASSDSELEFMERGGSFFTPRIVNDPQTNAVVHQQINPSTLEDAPFAGQQRRLKLALTTPGALDTLHFVDDPMVSCGSGGLIGGHEVEIDVKSIGMSHRDLLAAKAQVDDEPGFEVSGVVAAVGADVSSSLKTGDRVAALIQGGGYAFKVRTRAATVFRIPDSTTFEAAATLPLAFCTAYYGLIELGRLAEGESVLVHAAAGPVGQAAICLAQLVGAEIFATVGNAEKKQLLMAEYGIPEDRIYYSRNAAFGSAVRLATKGQGVDVVLNSATGDALRESWECLNNFGRFVDIGRKDAQHGSNHKTRLEMAAGTNSNSSYISVDIFAVAAERPKVIGRLIRDVARLLENGKIRPVAPVTAFPISDVETAFKSLQTAKLPGKLVVVPRPGEVVKATRSQQFKGDFLRADATYILIGGTGGLGRSMARWMVGNGARNIVLVSRSGSATGKVKELIDDLGATGANIVVRKCNVVNKDEVDRLVASGLQGLPPVRGVVHGTMVLHDVLFEKMTWEDYTTVIEGKVQGAWNIHHALSGAPLDFFVAISSAAGAVGNRGQAAYAAANCFLNALVQHRIAQGLPAASLDLTMVSDSGYLANGGTERLAEVARNLGSDSICEAEVLALLGAAITGRLSGSCGGHAITGMRITPAMRPFWTSDAKFKHLRLAMEEEAAAAEAAAADGDGSARRRAAVAFGAAALKAAASREEAEAVVCAGLVDKISTVLMLEPEDLDVTRSLSHYPLDSLVAIEIRNFIAREFEANMQVLELLSSGSIQTLAKAVCGKSKIVSFT